MQPYHHSRCVAVGCECGCEGMRLNRLAGAALAAGTAQRLSNCTSSACQHLVSVTLLLPTQACFGVPTLIIPNSVLQWPLLLPFVKLLQQHLRAAGEEQPAQPASRT
jgi:hypothetical protein